MDIIYSEPPPKQVKIRRLNKELRSMKSGQSVVLDIKTATAASSFYRYRGVEVRRRSLGGGKIQIWIV